MLASKLLSATFVEATGPVSFVWDTTISNSSMTFSNNNRTAANGGNWYQTALVALPTRSGGKFYWEVTETITNNFGNFGVGNSTSNNEFYQNVAEPYYIQRASEGFFVVQTWTGTGGSISTMTSGSRRYGFAYEVSSRKLWVRQDGGTWINGGNPTNGTDPSVTLTGTSYLVGSTYSTTDQSFTITHRNSQTDTPPTDFIAIGGTI